MSKVIEKAKRRLSGFNFEAEGSHVALVGKNQGGPANGVHTLITKSVKDLEEINKAEIQVKLDVVTFLTRFFDMWHHDAATLSEIFGIDTGIFDEEFSFEEFNSIGASEVTLLKAAGNTEKTEESLVAYVNDLDIEGRNTLKAYLAEGFNQKLQEHTNMSTELEKALEAKEVELKKAFEVELQKAVEEASEAKAKLEEINKAAEEVKKVEFIEKAKSFGGAEDLGLAMAAVAGSEQGMVIIKALEDAHKRLDEVIEKEAGFTGDIKEESTESPIMKAMKAKYQDK